MLIVRQAGVCYTGLREELAMEFIQAMADLVGISSTGLIAIAVAGVVLIAAWYVFKAAFKIAAKTFALGCVTIVGLVAGLYVVFVVLRAIQ
jgi:hypothetical protein